MNKDNNITNKKVFDWRINIEIENDHNCNKELKKKKLIGSINKYKSSVVIILQIGKK